MKLIIIRHAEPDYSIDSLTEKGWREANLLADRLEKMQLDHLFCSPLGRAQDTAKPYLERTGRSITVCDWLEEFSGYTFKENSENGRRPWDQMPAVWTADKDNYDRDKWIKTDLMQSGDVEQKYRWVCNGLDELLSRYGYRKDGDIYRVERENEETVVLFCHFGVECVLLSHILGVSPLPIWHGFVALPSSVTILNTEEREKGIASFRCSRFGDLSHLYAADEPESFAARFCETYSSEDRH